MAKNLFARALLNRIKATLTLFEHYSVNLVFLSLRQGCHSFEQRTRSHFRSLSPMYSSPASLEDHSTAEEEQRRHSDPPVLLGHERAPSGAIKCERPMSTGSLGQRTSEEEDLLESLAGIFHECAVDESGGECEMEERAGQQHHSQGSGIGGFGDQRFIILYRLKILQNARKTLRSFFF